MQIQDKQCLSLHENKQAEGRGPCAMTQLPVQATLRASDTLQCTALCGTYYGRTGPLVTNV